MVEVSTPSLFLKEMNEDGLEVGILQNKSLFTFIYFYPWKLFFSIIDKYVFFFWV